MILEFFGWLFFAATLCLPMLMFPPGIFVLADTCLNACDPEATSASLTANGLADCFPPCGDGRHGAGQGCSDSSCTAYNGLTIIVPQTGGPCAYQLTQTGTCDSTHTDQFAVIFTHGGIPDKTTVTATYSVGSSCDAGGGFTNGFLYQPNQVLGNAPQNCAGLTITWSTGGGAGCAGSAACNINGLTLTLNT